MRRSSGLSGCRGPCWRGRIDVGLEALGELASELREGRGELADEIDVAQGGLVPDAMLRRSGRRRWTSWPWVAEADGRAAHGDDGRRRDGAEDDDALAGRHPGWPGSPSRASQQQLMSGSDAGPPKASGFAAGPAGDGLLEGAEASMLRS